MSLSTLIRPEKLQKLIYGLGVFAIIFLITLGIFARNGWLPHTDGLSGKKTGWFGRELPKNASGIWNPLVALLPSGTPQLSKEYVYAGSRLLAVEDANAGTTLTPTPTMTATPSPTPFGYEGDVAPQFNGDGVVDATDVVIVRYFATQIMTPNTLTNEFQRADEAPFLTLGDGILDTSDVTQVRRYVTGLDPLTPAGGPTGSGNAPESAIQNLRQKSETSVCLSCIGRVC